MLYLLSINRMAYTLLLRQGTNYRRIARNLSQLDSKEIRMLLNRTYPNLLDKNVATESVDSYLNLFSRFFRLLLILSSALAELDCGSLLLFSI